AKQMQARAQERVAQETNEEGVNTSDPFILALAEADTPEEVSAVMVQYGGSDGQTSQQLLDLMRFTSNGEPLPGSVTFKPKE
ncbi:MAG TPA: hypothetical protein VK447_13250, partial [Myxococcaceae bacterium]|nr:hypothetical protein [Myxococcaceae bacterium]